VNQGNYADALRAFKRSYFGGLLEWTHGDVTEVAKMSGMERAHLYRVFKAVGLEPKQYRKREAA
jgi:DNA-binding NtrC family response regulator